MARRAKGEGSLIRRKGCRYWYASFYDAAGHQQRVSTQTEVKQEALGILRKLMGDDERGLAPASAARKLTYGDLRGALIANYIERGNKSLETRADGTETIVGLTQLDTFFGYDADNPGVPALRLNTDAARDFVRKRQADGAGPAMINRSLACLRRMLHIAHEDGKLHTVPKIRLLKEPGSRKGFVELAAFQKLIGALPSYLRPLITFLYYCGVRKNEALQIDWSQVDLDSHVIRLEPEQTKNSEARVIPLPGVVVMMLQDMDPKTGPVFDGSNLRTEWARACTAAGLGKIEKKQSEAGWTWEAYTGLIVHDLRRSALRNLRRAGVTENVAMKISGHKTRSVFERYNIVSTDDVTEAMRRVEVQTAKALPGISAKLVQNTNRETDEATETS